MTPDEPSINLFGYLWNALAGMFGGAAIGGIFIGGTRARLDAHEQRLDTAESDVRYEIRALRETVEENHRQVMGSLAATKRGD